MTVSEYQSKPYIRIVALYLERFGFQIGDKIKVFLSNGEIIIKKQNDNNKGK